MRLTDGGDKPAEDPTRKPPENKPPKAKLYAECMGRHANLGGVLYHKGEIVELKGALEAEARANPAGWRIYPKEG